MRLGTQLETVQGVSICEQKATDDARSQIRKKVWPEITRYESGERDDQLVAEVAALLEKQNLNTAIELASAIYWQDKRWYRVAVTVSEDQSREKMLSLFAGFENKAAGVVERRSGEVLPVGDVRVWMDQFCLKVTAELNALKPVGK